MWWPTRPREQDAKSSSRRGGRWTELWPCDVLSDHVLILNQPLACTSETEPLGSTLQASIYCKNG
jgi:hypothetical protein